MIKIAVNISFPDTQVDSVIVEKEINDSDSLAVIAEVAMALLHSKKIINSIKNSVGQVRLETSPSDDLRANVTANG